MAKKQRTDADRRVRQCERLGRLLRLLHLIMGKGRWDATTLAQELECSKRTVYRLLQTLSMAGVPWFFDDSCRAYRVRPGFKFPILVDDSITKPISDDGQSDLPRVAAKLIDQGEAFAETLKEFLDAVRQL